MPHEKPASRSTPDAVIVVATFERPDHVRRLVAALESQTYPRDRFEVVIVDDGSRDNTLATLTELRSQSSLALRVLRTAHNAGPAGARNLGWRSSRARFVAFTDDDCVPEPEWLAEGLAMLRAEARVGVVQGCTLRPTDQTSYPYTDWTVTREILRPTPWFEGCNLFFRREALEHGGGFDESIGWFGEETALGWAVLAHGWQRAFADDAVVRHDLDERGVGWHVKHRFLEGNLVGVARRYPRLQRDGFWRPWAVHRQNAFFALGVAGTLLAPWRRVALLLWLPYLYERHPPRGHPRFFRYAIERAAVDAAAFAGMALGSVRHRRLVL